MFAQVKFLNDPKFCIVPVSYIKNFDPTNVSNITVYEIFWSPDEDLSPSEFEKDLQASSNKTGYYKGLVLHIAETEEQLGKKIEEKRIRIVTEKVMKDDEPKTTSCSTTNMRTESKKAAKASLAKSREDNLKTLQSIDEENNNLKQEKLKKLNGNADKKNKRTKRSHKKLESLFDSCSSVENSEDDVVPKKLVLEEKKENERYRAKYLKMKKNYSEVLELNIQLQKKILALATPTPTSCSVMTSTGTTTPSYRTTPSRTVSSPPAQSPCSELTPTSPPMTSSKNTPPSKTMTCTKSTPDVQLSPTNPQLFGVDGDYDDFSSDQASIKDKKADDQFKLTEEKLTMVTLHVKPGPSGDSQFTKNLAAAIWPADILAKKSVSGRKGNFKGSGVAKPQMTPEKLQYIRDAFRKRLLDENHQMSLTEMTTREKNIPTYLSQKVATLNRVVGK